MQQQTDGDLDKNKMTSVVIISEFNHQTENVQDAVLIRFTLRYFNTSWSITRKHTLKFNKK